MSSIRRRRFDRTSSAPSKLPENDIGSEKKKRKKVFARDWIVVREKKKNNSQRPKVLGAQYHTTTNTMKQREIKLIHNMHNILLW
jgi:hypothetical protein